MALVDLLGPLPPDARVVAALTAAAILGLVAHALLFRALARVGRRAPALLLFHGALLRRIRPPTRLLFPLVAARLVLPLLGDTLSPGLRDTVQSTLYVLLVAAIAWVLIALTHVLDDVVARRFDVAAPDNLRARRVHTQVGLLRRVLVIGIALFAMGLELMRFEGFQTLGTGLLASAGVVGIVVGIAAQRPLANLVAGIQLALTQPVRVHDAVVMEGEWGTVEEITLTYVVVRIWDARRLVVPISYLFEHPFQNWTRRSAHVIGSVFLYVDYTAPVAEIRAEHERLVRASSLWDGRVCKLQVTDATERAMQLRAIMSAADAGRTWDLRCEVREKLIAFLQRTHPEALPRLRVAELDASGDERDAGAGAGASLTGRGRAAS